MERERKDREQQWFEDHEEMAQMFQENRLIFELERKRLIGEKIDRYADNHIGPSLSRQQEELEEMLSGNPSPQNRMALVEKVLIDKLHNELAPAVQRLKELTQQQTSTKGKEHSDPRL